MFSWSKKKESKRRERPERSSEENEFGIKLDKGPSDKQLEAELKALTGLDNLPDDEINFKEGEEDVESELLRLVGGNGKGIKNRKKPTNSDEVLGDASVDITSDVEDIGDEDVEVDEDDPDLLEELLELTHVEDPVQDEPETEPEPEPEPESSQSGGESDTMSVLKERLKMYRLAEAKAKENNESSRARRFSRGIKTLEDLIKKAKGGKTIPPGDIPPVIAMNLKPPSPVQPETMNVMASSESGGGGEESEETFSHLINEKPETGEETDILALLMERLKLYQTAEAKSKESGETTRARRFNRGVKTIEGLIQQAKAGNPISSSDIPPVVALNLKPVPLTPVKSEECTLENSEEGVEDEIENINPSEGDSDSKEEDPERNIIDVLSERLQMYSVAEEKAKKNGEGTRARRFARGIKTIQNLIRQATAGKPILPADIPPTIALNLKPESAVVVSLGEEEPKESIVEKDSLVRCADSPIKFSAVDDVDIDEDLSEEEIPLTVLDGLNQRLRIYMKLKQKAEEEGNETLADQNQRIVGMYMNAIATFKNGGYIDVQKLPTPKGCPPIPIPFHIP